MNPLGISISPAILASRILIIDDEPTNVRLAQVVLQQAGFTDIEGTTDPTQAVGLFQSYNPDIVLLDLHMPTLDGFAVMAQLRPLVPEGTFLPILVLTADITPPAKIQALASGAKDFLTKPFDRTEVLLRVSNLLETRLQNVLMEGKVQGRTRNLEEAQLETLQRLALAAEYRDDDTGLHTRRVGDMAARLALALGLPAERAELLHRAAPLHDVGKIGISDTILLKPGKLTPEEFDTMKTHTTIGTGILAGSSSPWLQLAETIALTHHERWAGGGYPQGLTGEAIPIEGRIVAIVDVFDALTNERPYKKAWPIEDALAELQKQSGVQFDPCCIEAFFTIDFSNE